MPSPFPGMDPYLEAPGIWPGVRAQLISVIREILTPSLRPRYWVDIEERLYVEHEDESGRAIRPDVVVSSSDKFISGSAPSGISPAPGFVAVEEPVEMPVRETYLAIRQMPGREVVTVLEVLSPANKAARGNGANEYLSKRNEVLASRSSLVEVDLLRDGERPLYVGHIDPHDYLVLVHRGWERPRVWARGWTLREALPPVPIPLLRDDDPVSLDLAHAMRLVYERGAYDLVLDYRRPPDPALSAGQQKWTTREVLTGKR